uniref:Uncharacterized protein n=1 Tax=Magallana gigas TaxID=29159 RepID=A0A8W8MI66_MAGGI
MAECEIITLSLTKEQKEAIEKLFEDNKWELTYQTIEEQKNLQPVPQERVQVCPYCFLSHCVATTNENSPWLGEGQTPSNYNPSVRKGLYRRFWKCISNLGGWDVEQYLRKKERLGEGRPNMVYHQRQVMSECVLKLVRSRYPNPHSVPYLGHKWE